MINATAISGTAAPSHDAAASLAAAPDRPRGAITPKAGAARSTAARPAAAKPAATKPSATRPAAAKAATAKTGAAASAATASSAAAKSSSSSTSAKSGYATLKLPAEFAFLNDPKISIEEKLSRFIGVMMTRSEQRLQAQMEKMAAGSTGAADAASSASGSKGSSSSSASKSGFSVWSLAKALVPPLGMASALLGDSTVKSLVGEVTGPVLAAGATALGLPELAPFALKLGPEVSKLITSDSAVAVPWLGPGGSATATGVASDGSPSSPSPRPAAPSAQETATGPASASPSASQKSSTASGSSTSVKVPATEGSTSEKAQLLELQRLQDQDKELFALFSNMLKAMHDARMTAIQNIR